MITIRHSQTLKSYLIYAITYIHTSKYIFIKFFAFKIKQYRLASSSIRSYATMFGREKLKYIIVIRKR